MRSGFGYASRYGPSMDPLGDFTSGRLTLWQFRRVIGNTGKMSKHLFFG